MSTRERALELAIAARGNRAGSGSETVKLAAKFERFLTGDGPDPRDEPTAITADGAHFDES